MSEDAMTEGQRELDRHIQDALRRLAFQGLAAVALMVIGVIVWAVRLEGKTEQNNARIEEVRREGSLPLQSLRTDIEVLKGEMRSLGDELRRTQTAIRGDR
jgi:cbb3-type cytochrome oxidase subunit 3